MPPLSEDTTLFDIDRDGIMADRYNLAGKETLNSIFRRASIGEITAPQGELMAALFLEFLSWVRHSLFLLLHLLRRSYCPVDT